MDGRALRNHNSMINRKKQSCTSFSCSPESYSCKKKGVGQPGGKEVEIISEKNGKRGKSKRLENRRDSGVRSDLF